MTRRSARVTATVEQKVMMVTISMVAVGMWRGVDLQNILMKERMGLKKYGYVGQGVVRI